MAPEGQLCGGVSAHRDQKNMVLVFIISEYVQRSGSIDTVKSVFLIYFTFFFFKSLCIFPC